MTLSKLDALMDQIRETVTMENDNLKQLNGSLQHKLHELHSTNERLLNDNDRLTRLNTSAQETIASLVKDLAKWKSDAEMEAHGRQIAEESLMLVNSKLLMVNKALEGGA